MKVVAIVQARMGSTRLPGKVLMDLGGETALARVLNRLRRSQLIQEVVVATTTSAPDVAIAQECIRLGAPFFRGSEGDVLDRYYRAALECQAEAVVRITADCPLIDPELVDDTVRPFLEQHADFASNVTPRRYPRGLDTEILSAIALERAWHEARSSYEREHVTPYIYEHAQQFKVISVRGHDDYSHYRWTLDTPEDLQLLRAIYSRFGNQDDAGWRDVVALMEREPQLAALNSQVLQKASCRD
jgi:spore coat polysaccharide biosynthesis protein SpsF